MNSFQGMNIDLHFRSCLTVINHFMPLVSFVPTENRKPPWFSVFRRYRKRPVAWNRLHMTNKFQKLKSSHVFYHWAITTNICGSGVREPIWYKKDYKLFSEVMSHLRNQPVKKNTSPFGRIKITNHEHHQSQPIDKHLSTIWTNFFFLALVRSSLIMANLNEILLRKAKKYIYLSHRHNLN